MAEAADCRNTCSQTGVIKYSGEFRGGPNGAVLLRRKRLGGSSCKKKRKERDETRRKGRKEERNVWQKEHANTTDSERECVPRMQRLVSSRVAKRRRRGRRVRQKGLESRAETGGREGQRREEFSG